MLLKHWTAGSGKACTLLNDEQRQKGKEKEQQGCSREMKKGEENDQKGYNAEALTLVITTVYRVKFDGLEMVLSLRVIEL
jgi:hypothetical protein